MQKRRWAATLAFVGVILGGCETISPSTSQPSTLVATDPALQQEREVVPSLERSEETISGKPSPRRAPVASRRVASPRAGSSPAPTRVEPEVTGASGRRSAAAADQSASEEQRQEALKRQRQLEQDQRFNELNRSDTRAIRSICSGC